MSIRGKAPAREIRLPCYGMMIRLTGSNPVEPACGSIASDLKAPGKTAAQRRLSAAVDGVESLVLAHACAGIDVQSPAYIEGIETAIDAIFNHYGL